MRMRLDARLQIASPNDRPPDPSSYANKNSYQSERTSASRYIIPVQRHRGNTVSGENVEKMRKQQLLAKIDDGKLAHSASSHLEVNVNHGLEISTTVPKENKWSSRENSKYKLQKLNQNLQKLQENQNLLNLHNNIKKLETSLNKLETSVELMIYLLERWKCADTV